MKVRKKKIFSKLYVMLFIIFLSLKCFSSVVSDNDGGAFITKAEFDSLKLQFQSQLDAFNTSIDSKITQAIASYLAGIRVTETNENAIIQNDWEEVVFLNGTTAPSFRLPEYSAMFSYGGYSTASSNQNNKILGINGIYSYQFEWNASQGLNCVRPLFGLISGSEDSIGDIFWKGIANRYHESYRVVFAKLDKFSDIGYLDSTSPEIKSIYLTNFFKLNYTGNLKTATETAVYNPTSVWYYRRNGTDSKTNPSSTIVYTSKISPSVVLDADSNGKTVDFEHIIQYDKDSEWCLSNEEFINTLYVNSNNTYTDTMMNSMVTKNFKGKYQALHMGYSPKRFVTGDLDAPAYTDAGVKYSSIGMIGIKKASQIYQYKDVKSIKISNVGFSIAKPTLEKGFHLLAGLKNENIKWEADFSEVYAYNGSTYVTNANEVDIYVSYEPFTNKTTSSDLIKFTVGGVQKDYITTTNRKATLKWTQNKDSIIYIKCVPHFAGTSYINNDWRVKLDLSGISKNYERKKI